MPVKGFTGSLRSYQASGLASGMRIGRQKEDAARLAHKSMLEEVYALAKSTFHRKEVLPSEVERVSELLCKFQVFCTIEMEALTRSQFNSTVI